MTTSPRMLYLAILISFLILAMSEDNGNYMIAVTVHDEITSPGVFDNRYLFLTISDVEK